MIEYERAVTVKSEIVFFTYLSDLLKEISKLGGIKRDWKFGRNKEEIETSRRERRML